MKPNVILINCDDMGYGDLACYGSKVNDTNAIDELARTGVKFNSFYASSSICTPSRASLMTGCYAQRVQMPLVLFPAALTGLNKNEFTMPKMFKNAGYNTMHIGKWHCGDNEETMPLQFGFDDYYGLPYSNDMGRQAHKAGVKREYLPPLPLIRGEKVFQAQPDQAGLTERYVEKSLEFIQKSVKEENPFFLYLAHMHVHLPLYEQERFLKESRNGDFGACMSSIDWSVAAILYELKSLGIYEDTMIVFTSDNGSRALDGASNYPLRGAKFSSYEGGLRVPFIVHWKGHIPEGVEIDNMASNIDLLPTFASLLNEPLSENKVDGVNILPMMFGEDSEKRDEFVYYYNYFLTGIRKGKYKLMIGDARFKKQIKYDPMELYDLENDISETTNIIADYPEIAQDLLERTQKYRTALGDLFEGTVGEEIRPCTQIKNPKPLAEYDENHPYIVSIYDKDTRG
ncbi:MAG: sulfatase [Clostridia bacterium]